VSGEEAARIFDASGTFVGGFEEVTHLTGDVAEDGHDKEMGERDGEPEMEGVGDEKRAEEAANGAFPGFLGRDVRGERMFAEGAADKVGDGVSGPGNGEGKEEEARTLLRNAVKTDGIGEWKGDQKKGARGNACGRKRFDERAAGEECEDGETEDKEQEKRSRRVKGGDPLVDRSPFGAGEGQSRSCSYGDKSEWPCGTPCLRDEQERAEDGPEAVGAVADGFAKGEIFPEGEDGEKGDGDGNGPGRSEEDDGDRDGHEDECSENASASHRGRSPFRLPANKWVVIAGRIEIIQRGYQISVIGYCEAKDEMRGTGQIES
jgi:hypothetical protein